VCFDVSVSINENTPDGKTWDGNGGLPDLKACFSDEWGYRCKVKNKTEPYCKDSLNCDLGVVYFIGAHTEVELTDIDLNNDDPIASKSCGVGASCNLGNAFVVFEKASCE
jgi:hypothetical protein